MNRDVRFQKSWRAHEARVFRPAPWLAAAAVLGLLLVEVWQSSTLTERVQEMDRMRSELVEAQARLEYAQARLEQLTTRTELAPLVERMGLVPADAAQIVHVPAEFLEDGDAPAAPEKAPTLLAIAERASRVLVPDATARGRGSMTP